MICYLLLNLTVRAWLARAGAQELGLLFKDLLLVSVNVNWYEQHCSTPHYALWSTVQYW